MRPIKSDTALPFAVPANQWSDTNANGRSDVELLLYRSNLLGTKKPPPHWMIFRSLSVEEKSSESTVYWAPVEPNFSRPSRAQGNPTLAILPSTIVL